MNFDLNNIDNVIFDLGGVIVDIDPHLTIDAFKNLGASELVDDEELINYHQLLVSFDTGKCTAHEFYEGLCQVLDMDATFEEVFEAWNLTLLEIPDDRIDTIRKISKFFDLYLMSNTNEIHIRTLYQRGRKDFDEELLLDNFEDQYLSFRVGMRKPDVEFFKRIVLDYNLDVSRTLFIDDLKENLKGAEELGMVTYHLDLLRDDSIVKLFEEVPES